MAAYNMPDLSTGASEHDTMAMNLGTGQPQGLTMDVFDQGLQFDESMLDGTTLPNLFPPGYDVDHFSSTFEDPFSYSARQFEPPPNQVALHEESSPQQLDDKLLGFSAPVSSSTITDENGHFAEALMSAELYGMFFVAEDVFGGETPGGRPLELTCYRRNLWQCSGQITLPRSVTHITNEQGVQIPIFELVAIISATESNEGKPAEIISIPWKNANAQPSDESKSIGPPPNITLDLTSGQEIDAHRLTLPVSWKRLQFKHATANNGRRKGLQQHFVVQIGLHGRMQNGELVEIAEIHSGPVIVRGRSPRNFDSRKDVPLTADKKVERRNTASNDNSSLRLERENSQGYVSKYPSLGNIQNDWSTPQSIPQPSPSPQPSYNPHPAKRMALSPNIPKPPVPAWSETNHASKQSAQKHTARHSTSLPINLSLSEDERSDNRSSSDLQSPQPPKGVPVAGLNSESSPQDDDIDPLYEYFPLTVDDWMPPVDAVYRPHVVHHTIVPPEMKAQQVRSKAKRYFAAD